MRLVKMLFGMTIETEHLTLIELLPDPFPRSNGPSLGNTKRLPSRMVKYQSRNTFRISASLAFPSFIFNCSLLGISSPLSNSMGGSTISRAESFLLTS
jgi:hypothetical protein